jgi:hypothetical protein
LHTVSNKAQILSKSECSCQDELAHLEYGPYISAQTTNHSPANQSQAKKRGFITTGTEIVKRETALGLYKGLGAVLTGIVPKMAIRFTSYEWYKQALADKEGIVSSKATFMGKFFMGKIFVLAF